jgi:hypothetical protein
MLRDKVKLSPLCTMKASGGEQVNLHIFYTSPLDEGWLRHYATRQEVASSRPDDLNESFKFI